MFKTCKNRPQIYSAKIEAAAGLDSPTPIPSLPGWTVWKKSQTEVYCIQHNLALTSAATQLHVVATPMDENTIAIIANVQANEFIVTTWTPHNHAPKQSSFMFIATRS